MRLTRLPMAVAALIMSLSLAGCSTQTLSSARASAGSWPYRFELVRATRITAPSAGPELAKAPDVPEGYVLLDVHVRIENDAASDTAQVTPPDFSGFTIIGSDGTTFAPVGGIGMYRTTESSAAAVGSSDSTVQVRHRGPSEMIVLASEPGASYVLNPQFVVPTTAEGLVLRFTPIRDEPAHLVEFPL